MSKRKLLVLVLLIVCLIGLTIFVSSLSKPKVNSMPKITLAGNKIVTLTIGEKYVEPGYTAKDPKDGLLTKNVKITSGIDFNKAGTYEILYQVKNKNGIKAEAHRFVKIVDKPFYKKGYDKLDSTKRGWWSDNKKDNKRPLGGADIKELKKYDAYFMGPDEKVLYLTFDEGSNDTYLKEIVDVLNKNEVKATFFLCGQYILDHKDLINEMVNAGHSIGNHTDNHYSMPSLANKKNFDTFITEIKNLEDFYYQVTGKQIDKVYREPRGEWSYRDLQILKDLGYKSFFYSADYLDWKGDTPKEFALDAMLKRYHNGAIYLLHPKNKGNWEALDDFIKQMKSKGYSFDLVRNIKKDN